MLSGRLTGNAATTFAAARTTNRSSVLSGAAAASKRVVVAATWATAASKAWALADEGRVKPLTLRTYWRAAASISSVVAGGSSPRNSVIFRHIRQWNFL